MARSDAITGKGLQHILDFLPDNFTACLSHSMLNGLAKLLQIAGPASSPAWHSACAFHLTNNPTTNLAPHNSVDRAGYL
jgi:hypothetical protein